MTLRDDNVVILKQVEKPAIIPRYELFIEEDLKFTCAAYGWLLRRS